MTPTNLLLVALGGMIGAPLRFAVDQAIQTQHDTVFPWGTLIVNMTGSLILGLVAASASAEPLKILLEPGFCSALTTYSTFGYETLRLTEDGSTFYALANIAANLLAGLGAALLGTAFGGL
jgi:fluoride exporter